MQTIAPSGEQEMTWSGHLLLLADRSVTVAQLRLMLQCCICRLSVVYDVMYCGWTVHPRE